MPLALMGASARSGVLTGAILFSLGATAFHLNEHQPGKAGQTTADPVAAQQFNDCNRAGSDAEPTQEKCRQRWQGYTCP